MSSDDLWTLELESELRELLAPELAPTPADQWRLLVLLARVSLHPNPPPALVAVGEEAGRSAHIRQALAAIPAPDSKAALDALDDALEDDDDPAGALADALLDVDDLLGVLELMGLAEQAQATATQAVALIDLAPERASILDTWAARRLETLDEGATAAEVWRAVTSAAAMSLILTLPLRTPHRTEWAATLDRADNDRSNQAEVIDLFTASIAVRRSWRPAAADTVSTSGPTYGKNWTIYVQSGRTFVQIRAAMHHLPTTTALLIARTQDGTWTRRLRAARVGTDSSWFDLGSEDSLAAAFDEARTVLGIGADHPVAVVLEWNRDGDG